MKTCIYVALRRLIVFAIKRRWRKAFRSIIWTVFLMISLVYLKLAIDRIGRPGNNKTVSRKDERFSSNMQNPLDELLGGLLSSEHSKSSCLSRTQLTHYLKPSPHKPSSSLITKLRSYEDLHERCAPHTKLYNESILQLFSYSSSTSQPCHYLVHQWMPESGLGNRFLSLVSSFLYAILTNRVLLIDQGLDMKGLFCEPFPNSTWVLPPDFPIRDEFKNFHASYSRCFGKMVKSIKSSFKHVPTFMYVNLIYDYNDNDKRFFCEHGQSALPSVPWLFIKSDQYFLPSLFSIPSFEKELKRLFPQTNTVFHHLGRYLFLPSDHVWGLVTRFYDAYLAKADERIGIQIRDYGATYLPFEGMKEYIFKYYLPHLVKTKASVYEETDVTSPLLYMMDKMLECSFINNLLPRVTNTGEESVSKKFHKRKSKAVLVTSLNSMYFENLTEMYSENPTIDEEVVGVFQPSQEGFQQNNDPSHNMKALAEMYLLSMMDELITSPWSTFGYVAQGLGGLKPWVINNPQKEQSLGGLPCFRTESIEPCFHFPPVHECEEINDVENKKKKSYVRSCEDTVWGLKLFDDLEL